MQTHPSKSTSKIPFFGNTADGTHCYQAALRMILTFFTHQEWPFETLDKISGKLSGKWTWPTLSMLWFLENGYEIQLIEEFDFLEFGKRGKDYLVEKCGEEVAQAQEKNSDLAREQKLALEFSQKGKGEFRIPTWEDLQNLLADGYLLILNVNAALMHGQKGYSGHFVVPVSVSDNEIVLHDPGLPPTSSLKSSRAVFEAAWGYPTPHEKNVLAIRPYPSK